jgi:hypothetical protein
VASRRDGFTRVGNAPALANYLRCSVECVAEVNYIVGAAAGILLLAILILVYSIRRARLAALGERALNACGGDWPTILESIGNMEWANQVMTRHLHMTDAEWLATRKPPKRVPPK